MAKWRQNKTQDCTFSRHVSKNLKFTRKLQINRQIILNCQIFLWLKGTGFKNKALNLDVFMPLFHKTCNWKDGQFSLKSFECCWSGQQLYPLNMFCLAYWQQSLSTLLYAFIYSIAKRNCPTRTAVHQCHKTNKQQQKSQKNNKKNHPQNTPPKINNKMTEKTTKIRPKTKNKTWRNRKYAFHFGKKGTEHF